MGNQCCYSTRQKLYGQAYHYEGTYSFLPPRSKSSGNNLRHGKLSRKVSFYETPGQQELRKPHNKRRPERPEPTLNLGKTRNPEEVLNQLNQLWNAKQEMKEMTYQEVILPEKKKHSKRVVSYNTIHQLNVYQGLEENGDDQRKQSKEEKMKRYYLENVQKRRSSREQDRTSSFKEKRKQVKKQRKRKDGSVNSNLQSSEILKEGDQTSKIRAIAKSRIFKEDGCDFTSSMELKFRESNDKSRATSQESNGTKRTRIDSISSQSLSQQTMSNHKNRKQTSLLRQIAGDATSRALITPKQPKLTAKQIQTLYKLTKNNESNSMTDQFALPELTHTHKSYTHQTSRPALSEFTRAYAHNSHQNTSLLKQKQQQHQY